MTGQQERNVFHFATFFVLTIGILCSAPTAHGQIYMYGRANFSAGTYGYVITADFNHDGRQDLAVSDQQNNTVDILLGSAGGGFVSSGSYATGSRPSTLVAIDFNGDKKMDLAVVTAGSGTISVLLGNGDGTFGTRRDYPVGENAAGLVAADFNGDGRTDLATVSTKDSGVAILLGDGNGNFEVQALVPVASAPTGLIGADLNGDGKTDLITCNDTFSNSAITVLLSKGDGTFTQIASQAPYYQTALAAGDFNHDGNLDVVSIANSSLYLEFGNGDGSFQNPVQIPNSPPISYNAQLILTGDFNRDGKLDIVVPGIWVMLGNGDGTFQAPQLSLSAASPMYTTDVNGDGQVDLVAFEPVSNYGGSGAVAILLGNGKGAFMDSRAVPVTSSYSLGAGVAADFNGDGRLDLAVAEGGYPNGQVSVELANRNGTFGQPIDSQIGSAAYTSSLLSADFNGDRKADLALPANDGFEILLGQGDGTFGTPADTTLSYYVSLLLAGDLNKDGKADIIAVSSGNNSGSFFAVFLSNGDGTFTPGQQYVIYSSPNISLADVNGDGNLDVVVTSSSSNLLVFLGKGDGTFQNAIFGPYNSYNTLPAIGDFNQDGKMDIAVGLYGYPSGGVALFEGNGDGTFQSPIYSNTAFNFSGYLVAGDFNGDGKTDLLANSCCGGSSGYIMTGNGDGTFSLPLAYEIIGTNDSQLPIMGDFNSDGVIDIGYIAEPAYNSDEVMLDLSAPAPNLFPASLTFGKVTVGKSSVPKKVRLANSGNAKLKISSITVSGDFLQQNNCGKALPVGKSCVIQVTFKPTSKGTRKGTLSIADNAPANPQMVPLSGVGQ